MNLPHTKLVLEQVALTRLAGAKAEADKLIIVATGLILTYFFAPFFQNTGAGVRGCDKSVSGAGKTITILLGYERICWGDPSGRDDRL